ncbi:MAG: ABC transporter permease, partial [Acidimicrobiia bacterium]
MSDVTGSPLPDVGLGPDEAFVASSTPSPYRRALRRLLHDKPAVISLVFLSLLIFAAVFAPLVVPHRPDDIGVAAPFSGPSLDTPFGTDSLGRDVFSRIIYGARISLASGFEIVFLALLAAVPIGLLAGFRGGGTDNLLMRLMDALASFPPLVLALAIVAILGPGLMNAVIAIAIVVIPGFARLVRAQTLAVRQETFIEASRSMGTKPGRIRRTRVLPNVASPLIVAVSLAMGAALVAEASLSLLGYGVEPSKPSWGAMIEQGRSFIYEHPWQVFVPSLALAITILAFNTLGDGLRDALGLGLPKGKRTIKGRLGLTTVDRRDDEP